MMLRAKERLRELCILAVAVGGLSFALAACGTAVPSTTTSFKAPPIGHVFTIVLENKGYRETWGRSPEAPFLTRKLAAKGQLLTRYYATGHFSLGNYITMLSGQSQNTNTQQDCHQYVDVQPGTIGADGQALGQGCVYPDTVKTLVDELRDTRRLDWRGYMEDMGDDPERERKRCAHPTIGSSDPTQQASVADQYATRHNPFAYFHSITDSDRYCRRHVVPLDALKRDLRSVRTTRNYTFITPDLCSDGHDDPCINPGQAGGYEGIDEFLHRWAPRILRSPAYRNDGLLVIVFDESEGSSRACCFVPTGPNVAEQGISGPGGGRTGALLISQWVKPGTTNDHPYNHYDLLLTMTDLFGVDPLGYAVPPAAEPFGEDVFSMRG